MNETTVHVAVMTNEILEALAPQSAGRYIDATLGGGTHTETLLKVSSPEGQVLSLDVDPLALKRGAERLSVYANRWRGVEGNFRHIQAIALEQGFADCDGILIDLGLSSDELSDPRKGLSFQTDGPLDMRLGPQANDDGMTAADIVNTWSQEDLEEIIRLYGEERYARRIAEGIVTARKAARLIGTQDLATVIRSAVPSSYEHGRIHPATRTFQALRIVVNDELGALQEVIAGSIATLHPQGVLAIITFHSLEDRIVKHTFRAAEELEVITKHPRIPSDTEMEQNPRARSAKLRIAKKK